jgi:hypothetical protein
MSITIKHTVWGFHVLFVTSDSELLSRGVEAFKAIIPKNNRRYYPEGRYWFVSKRREKKLREWIDRVKELGDVRIFEVGTVENSLSANAAG